MLRFISNWQNFLCAQFHWCLSQREPCGWKNQNDWKNRTPVMPLLLAALALNDKTVYGHSGTVLLAWWSMIPSFILQRPFVTGISRKTVFYVESCKTIHCKGHAMTVLHLWCQPSTSLLGKKTQPVNLPMNISRLGPRCTHGEITCTVVWCYMYKPS